MLVFVRVIPLQHNSFEPPESVKRRRWAENPAMKRDVDESRTTHELPYAGLKSRCSYMPPLFTTRKGSVLRMPCLPEALCPAGHHHFKSFVPPTSVFLVDGGEGLEVEAFQRFRPLLLHWACSGGGCQVHAQPVIQRSGTTLAGFKLRGRFLDDASPRHQERQNFIVT